MSKLQLAPVLLLFTILMSIAPPRAFAQASQPTTMTLSTSSIQQGECFTMSVGNGANMSIDVYYQFYNQGGAWQYTAEIDDWPHLDGNGNAEICTDGNTALGRVEFSMMRNTLNTAWVDLATPYKPYIFVLPPAPQPTGLSFDAPGGYAGNTTFTVTVENGASMSVDVLYTLAGGPDWTGTIDTDVNGQYSYAFGHYEVPGEFVFKAIKNSASANWVDIDDVYYTLYPPHPTNLIITGNNVVAGSGSYGMNVGNGGAIALDFNRKFNGVAQPTVWGFPYLAPSSPGSDNGYADVSVGLCATPGNYMFTEIWNNANGIGGPRLATGDSFTVSAPGAPYVSSLSAGSAVRNSNVSVTITGDRLCGVWLEASWPGLGFGSIANNPSSDGHGVTIPFTVAASAWVGTATVTLHANGGIATFPFNVLNNSAPAITGITPAVGMKGTSVAVTINGSNLGGATLSTTWSGLTFSNVSPNPQGTSLTATFNISGSATTGNPVVKVTTSAGEGTNSSFSIAASPMLSREYIYLGDRVIAADSP